MSADPAGPLPTGVSVEPPLAAVRDVVAVALDEDLLPLGDLTSALLPKHARGSAVFVVHEAGVLAGRACAIEAFDQVDPTVEVDWRIDDGTCVQAGARLAAVRGSLASILTAERTALNFLRHLSGIATLTRRFVDAVAGPSGGRTRILDTRKTTPGLRVLEKAAVRAGGGHNHRANLSDGVMIKENHLAGMSIRAAVERARAAWPGRPVHVECEDLDQVPVALAAGVDRVMLDNLTPEQVAQAVGMVGALAEVEVTGGITIGSVAAYAAARPDFISVGALTHSAGALDISLDVGR